LGPIVDTTLGALRRHFGDSGRPVVGASDREIRVGLAVVVLSLLSALATYLIVTGLTPIVPRSDVVLGALLVNIVLIVAMVAVIAWQISGLWRAWANKAAGARLHIRVVGLFSIIAAVPAILLAIAATTTFSRSFDSVLDLTRRVVESSQEVANQYLEQHGQIVRAEVLSMAKDLDSEAVQIEADPRRLQQRVLAQAGLRALSAAYVIDGQGEVIVTGISDDQFLYEVPGRRTLAAVRDGETPVAQPRGTRYFVGLTKLQRFPEAYLYVARRVDPLVLGYVQRADATLAEYNETRRRRGQFTFVHGLIYSTLSLTALLAAIWVGLWFAGRFVAPIRRLIIAAQQVSEGNLAVALPERRGEGDLRRLSETFNHMTRELKSQRDELVATNDQLSERRRFIEAVLSGVSAGVIGLNRAGRATLVNRSAEQLLQLGEHDLVGKPLADTVPAFAALIAPESITVRGRSQDQISVGVDGEERTFSVRVTRERIVGEDGDVMAGLVVTFDDITELVAAQRTSAWADVARRIAHEIKNPLTPIILSAERIRRKYGKAITEDRETFDKLTATIERQAGDIKTMVDEFASFARVPKPVIEPGDLRDAVQEPVILFRESHPQIEYVLEMPDAPVSGHFDRRLVTQALTNLVKNASESVATAREGPEPSQTSQGKVVTRIVEKGDTIAIEVIDNGVGLPNKNRSRLLEPYVSTKGNKGTGLGLAIVQKIVEQHGGSLELEDAPPVPGRDVGALVRISLPRVVDARSESEDLTDNDAGAMPAGVTS